MRQIGHLPAGQARVFSDYLQSQRVRHEVERENDGTYAIWVHDEDQLAQAETLLKRFSADPHATEFVEAGDAAERVRAQERQEHDAYRRRIHSRQRLFPKFGGYGVGVVSYALIFICVLVFVQTKLGTDEQAVQPFLIADRHLNTTLQETVMNQPWRLFTPIFLHFGIVHIVFNMMWLFQLGCMIEGRRGSLRFLVLVAFLASVSNVAQFLVSGRPTFGGMSGVVYGLAGYVWLRGRMDRESGLFLDNQSILMLLVWQAICFTGLVGPIANTAHIAGLLAGLSWGWAASLLASRKPQE